MAETMLIARRMKLNVWVSAALVLAVSCLTTWTVTAQSMSDKNAETRDLLFTPETAKGLAPAHIKLDIANAKIPSNAQLELTVEPTVVSNERYIVVVSSAAQPNKQIGSFSFFPPARVGNVQKFLVDAVPLLSAMQTKNMSEVDLSVQLIPVDRDNKLGASALRILGARLVGG